MLIINPGSQAPTWALPRHRPLVHNEQLVRIVCQVGAIHQHDLYKGNPTQRRALHGELRMNNSQVLLTTYEYIIKDRPEHCKVKWLHMTISMPFLVLPLALTDPG